MQLKLTAMRCYAPDPARGDNSAPQNSWYDFGEKKGRRKEKEGKEKRRGERNGKEVKGKSRGRKEKGTEGWEILCAVVIFS